ncbi:phage head-tail connector protein [Anaerosporobacter sp.]|uniref:phage head-tail connector protein n=1 Tax=Anaerosporobacter sp. TaxID=1872529 RepID=UPI00286F2506|nr:phage head-tail connector protein [Anaerosporobacter sp.]
MAEMIDVKYRLLAGLDADDLSMDSLLSIYLEQAEKAVIKARHPYGSTEIQKIKALDDYSDNVESIYIYLWNKRGAEGQTSHNENGINRAYESAGIPNSFLADIVPFVKIF